jgi:hypothetical protein
MSCRVCEGVKLLCNVADRIWVAGYTRNDTFQLHLREVESVAVIWVGWRQRILTE